MSYHWCDNVHTATFTPRDYQVELVAAAFERNIMACIGHKSSKEFITLKLIQELAHNVRKKDNRKWIVYLAEEEQSAESAFNLIQNLTDLKVFKLSFDYHETGEYIDMKNYHVVVGTYPLLDTFIVSGSLGWEGINLIIIEDCHETTNRECFSEYLQLHSKKTGYTPKIFGLAGPLYNAAVDTVHLSIILDIVEKDTNCKTETASDIVTVLRYCLKPSEYIIQCAPPYRDEVVQFLEELVCTKRAFLEDHRFDPTEIYSDEYLEELKAIPDPKTEPLQFLNSYLDILLEMGPWCADRAALNLLTQIERQKVKTPYERHFLLLCLVSTTLVEIRAHCDYKFQKIHNEKERVEKYSSPKVLRLFEILRLFKPEEIKVENENLAKVSDEIDSLDFQKLQIELEKTFRNVENDERKDVEGVIENLGSILHESPEVSKRSTEISEKSQKETGESAVKSKRGVSGRQKKKNYSQGGRNKHLNNANDSDALYGIIFCENKNTAKVLFDLLCEMSRNDPDLNFLNVQYTVDRTADPLTEPKEAELEHRRQEEVLKRFRMHECNLLIGTTVLEEGIDLPKCNLVIRWDQPTTYRSYVQCKGRARAAQALHVILVGPKLHTFSKAGNENLTNESHRYICAKENDSSFNDVDNFGFENGEIKEERNIGNYNKPEVSDNNHGGNDHNEHVSDHSPDFNDHNQEEKKKKTQAILTGSVAIESIDDIISSLDFSKNKTIENLNRRFNCVVEKRMQNNDATEYAESMSEMENATSTMIIHLAEYKEIEKILLLKCANSEPSEVEHIEADTYTKCIIPYKPLANTLTGASVDLGNAIALINKYCAKLPSDTFTKLTPLSRCAKTVRNGKELYHCTLRLPINSPLKYDILGLPMPSKVLARRMAALIACRELHKCGELDSNLQPIGKEGFKASEPDWEDFELEKLDEQIVNENSEPRPGTTKRRQYYYKRIASEFSNCRPTVGSQAYLYLINMTLQCPIPEEQNTRGRKIYPPEEAVQGFGILTLKKIPKVSAFPIFTRSGEVKVAIELSKHRIVLNEPQVDRINTFLNYTFTNVLRLQKFLMLFDAEATENCVYIVPTIKIEKDIIIDWNFLEEIYKNADKMPRPVPDNVRQNTEFDPNKFKDAVVMPWYRNQDQPQYFYVAEICYHLSPESSFPGENYSTFQEYYYLKYNITIQNKKQPLLDVDHTSARLNFLTPRYVNRKGVALPTSSEETKRAKRENLEQKQILVPELCTIHPFPASLWRAAVCLPCILYRINGLLLADEIRKKVSYDIALGRMEIEENNFEWPILDFGWSLAEVLKKSRDAKQSTNKSENNDSKKNTESLKSTEKKLYAPEGNVINGKAEEHEKVEKQDNSEQEKQTREEKTANDLLEEADEKLKSDCLLEIGTWSNDMANNIKQKDFDEDEDDWGILPPNVNLCSRNNTNIRYGSPTSWDVGGNSSSQRPIETYYTDSDASFQSDDDYDIMSVYTDDDQDGPIRIEFKSNNTAEAVETEEEILKMEKQLAIIQHRNFNEKKYQIKKNSKTGFSLELNDEQKKKLQHYADQFDRAIRDHYENIHSSKMLVEFHQKLDLPRKDQSLTETFNCDFKKTLNLVAQILGLNPDGSVEKIKESFSNFNLETESFTIDNLFEINKMYINANGPDKYVIDGFGDIFDNFNDRTSLVFDGETKGIYITFEKPSPIVETSDVYNSTEVDNIILEENTFSFDYQPNLVGHPGPSPSIILQALTMSNANDGINLERLETIGDSFLKYAITTYLYCKYEDVHEGKLSHLRSKQVSNLNLYRLGRRKVLGECMIATKFEPHDNWLPPCYYVPKELEKALIEAKIPPCHWNLADLPNIKNLSSEKICELVKKKADTLGLLDDDDTDDLPVSINNEAEINENFPCFIPYNLVTQHSIPDKSIADCVEALIGAYLIECGPRGALLFMAWLGIRVLPIMEKPFDPTERRIPGSSRPTDKNNEIIVYGNWTPPKSPLLMFAPNPREQLELLLDEFSVFEESLGYYFKDRSYLLQAMTHASYSPNRLTDCYQRLEFLGDAVLDYLITRHLYEDPRQHSPGALTDLRSALVNNTIFASLAVRHGFHKYFRHLSPGLNEVIDRFVSIQNENGHSISEEYYLLSEEECDDAEDVEVPKALGDVFESVAGAIFLDSNMSLDTVWKVYSNMMKPEIEQFSNSVPKSPIRELLELEPETAKFGKPEKLADGRRVRVTVEVFGKGTFRGIGRNYRIAKCTAAKCALRQLKKQGLISKKH